MKIVFLIEKNNYYRNFLPLIKEGIKRGHSIECWHNYSKSRTGQKWYSFPEVAYAPSIDEGQQIKVEAFYGSKDLLVKLKTASDIDAVISLHAPDYYLEPAVLKNLPIQWISLLAFCDILFEQNNHPEGEKQLNSGMLFLYTRFWLDKGREFLQRFRPQRKYLLEDAYSEYFFLGLPEFDAFNGIDPVAVRKKYRIPEDKDILLYLPFPYNNRAHNSGWEMGFCGIFTDTAVSSEGTLMHHKKNSLFEGLKHKTKCLYNIAKDPLSWECIFKGVNEPNVFKSVKKFCEGNNLYLVVKPRLKFPVPEIIKKEADLLIWDDEKSLNPPVLKELLSVARMTVSFYSYSVLSSVFAKVFHLNVGLSKGFSFRDDAGWFWMPEGENSIFNYKGACESWEASKLIRRLKNMSLDRFKMDPAARAGYVDKFIGRDDFNSSAYFFNALEDRLYAKEKLNK